MCSIFHFKGFRNDSGRSFAFGATACLQPALGLWTFLSLVVYVSVSSWALIVCRKMRGLHYRMNKEWLYILFFPTISLEKVTASKNVVSLESLIQTFNPYFFRFVHAKLLEKMVKLSKAGWTGLQESLHIYSCQHSFLMWTLTCVWQACCSTSWHSKITAQESPTFWGKLEDMLVPVQFVLFVRAFSLPKSQLWCQASTCHQRGFFILELIMFWIDVGGECK
jgi:hypothetical protein